MGYKFLSDEWFNEVARLTDVAGDVEAPANLKSLVLNVAITGGASEVQMCVNGGTLEKGHNAASAATLTMPATLAKKLFIDGDQSAAMSGFMSGQIKIQGDMSKLMVMQTAQPSAKQQALQKQVAEMTTE
jgi:putative sterol carrier protein